MTIKDDCVYKFGVDPSWCLGKNELTKWSYQLFKCATQMALGVVMKAFNSI